MLELRHFARYGALGLIASFAGIAGWKLLAGGISLDGLLDSSSGGRARSSPARLQLLLITLVAAIQYVSTVLHDPTASSLPPVPQSMLAIVAGSQGVYLGGKALATYVPMLKKRIGDSNGG